MKIWQAALLTMLLATAPVFSACDYLLGSRQQEENYRQQLEAIKEVQEANRQQQEEYNERLQQGLNEWAKAYSQWQQQQQQQQIEQLEETPATGN